MTTREEIHKRHVVLLAEIARDVARTYRRPQATLISDRLNAYGRFPRKRYHLKERS